MAGEHEVPSPHLSLRTDVTPCSERVANGTHADKGGGFVGKRGGVGARTAEQRRRKGGACANTVWWRTPPPPLQARGEWGVAPCACRKLGAEMGGGEYKAEEARQRGEG